MSSSSNTDPTGRVNPAIDLEEFVWSTKTGEKAFHARYRGVLFGNLRSPQPGSWTVGLLVGLKQEETFSSKQEAVSFLSEMAVPASVMILHRQQHPSTYQQRVMRAALETSAKSQSSFA